MVYTVLSHRDQMCVGWEREWGGEKQRVGKPEGKVMEEGRMTTAPAPSPSS